MDKKTEVIKIKEQKKQETRTEKHHILKHYFGYDSFRQGQEDLIDHILQGGDVLGIMPTGAGKSLCYQVPALMLGGLTLVISPLISLMKDQVNALVQSGVKAAFINSSLSWEECYQVMQDAADGNCQILYVAPERLMTEAMISFVQKIKIAMVTVDEAHCVSQWGQDFRPSYLKIAEFIEKLPQRPIISAFTATATTRVKEDVIHILGLQDPHLTATGFDRKNLYFEVQKPAKKMPALLEFLKENKFKSGIVYCLSRKSVEEVCEELNRKGYAATRYHAGLDPGERKMNQDDFMYDKKPIMVATNAFGMGIDKSNVAFVVHYNMPRNLENYYQEAGRAGRDGQSANCLLLYSGRDVRTNQFLIENSQELNDELSSETKDTLREKDMELLKLMTFYCTTTDCLRAYMLEYFGETAPHFCGNCGNCNTNFETVDITLDAQKILSCVYWIEKQGRGFGKVMIANILHGSRNEKILSFRLDQLRTYGAMADTPVTQIRSVMDYLIEKGYLRMSDDEYPVVRLTASASEILIDKNSLEMKQAKKRKPAAEKGRFKEQEQIVNPELFQRLKELRSRLASKAHVPAYVIFTDASLQDMCKKLPLTEDAFLEVSGVGLSKLQKYGKVFIKAIEEYVR